MLFLTCQTFLREIDSKVKHVIPVRSQEEHLEFRKNVENIESDTFSSLHEQKTIVSANVTINRTSELEDTSCVGRRSKLRSERDATEEKLKLKKNWQWHIWEKISATYCNNDNKN